MHPAPTAPWIPDFDFYEARMDDARVILALDLAARQIAPLKSHPYRLQIRVRMLQPRDDGLRSKDEASALFALEDRIAERLASETGAIQVGRVLHQGYTLFVFYLGVDAAARCSAELIAIVGNTAPYQLEWLTTEDVPWNYYHDFLWPDAYAHQTIMNRRLLAARAERGDCPEIVREVDHLAYFKDREQAGEAAKVLAGAGFRVDPVFRDDGRASELAWRLEFHRDDSLEGQRSDEIACQILDLILPLGGSYDGWGAVIELGLAPLNKA